MRIQGINEPLENNISSKRGASSGQSVRDSYEINIRNQIKSLQEEKKKISNDDKLSGEQKSKEKQALQKEIQSLNSELKQYQIEKRQEEVQNKQKTASLTTEKTDKKSNEKTNEKLNEKDVDENPRVFGDEKLGVIITISLTKEQVANLHKVRKDLEGKQRTAETDEEKSKFQEKINNVSKGIGKKIIITEDAILESRNPGKYGTNKKQDKVNASEQDAAVIAGMDSGSKVLSGRNGWNSQGDMFENMSVVVK